MRTLTLAEVLRLHADLVAATGGAEGVRDLARVESALAQPLATFDGSDLYPTIVDKAAALGNISADVDVQESVILAVASGKLPRDELRDWLAQHLVPLAV